jgi:cobalamin biosynthesis protein CobW
MIFDVDHGQIAPELLFGGALHRPLPPASTRSRLASPGFETMSWTAASPLTLARFQAMIGQLTGVLVRAKGIVRFAEQPERPMLFQLVGQRATLSPGPAGDAASEPVRLVLIARSGALDEAKIRDMLTQCVAPPSPHAQR